MKRTVIFGKDDELNKTWLLISLYLLIPLAVITIAIWHSYQLEALLNDNLEQVVSEISEEGMGSIRDLHLFSWLALAFLLLLLLFSVPFIQKRFKLRDLLQKRLLNAEIEKEQKVQEMLQAVEKQRAEADRLNLLKTQFIANVSHEIRTPLNAILGFSNLLNRTALDAQQQEFSRNIHRSGENLLAIINDILDFSRIEAGALRLEKVPFNLRALLYSLESIFRYRANEKELVFEIRAEAGLPENLLGDPTRLTQILINLLSNAFKFTAEGGVSLSAGVVGIDASAVTLRFVISDTGIGIAPDQLEHIFERFGQASSETTRKYGGTGLGLTISRQLIDMLHGTIEVESREGIGTTFTLEIPYQLAGQPAGRIAAEPLAQEQSNLNAQVSILLVEDNPMNQRIAELLLDDWGFRHDHAVNGRVALEMLSKKVYDLVLMDIQMPEMDGYTAAGKIRQELHLQVPIIATTAHAFAGEREKCLSYGMNDYISKPMREEELLKLIRHYLPTHKKINSAKAAPQSGSAKIPEFDRQYVLEVSRNKPDRLRQMADIFLDQTEKELQLLDQLLTQNNFDEAAAVAHSMKSTVSYMGFEASLGRQLKELEMQLGEADTKRNNWQALLLRIRTETQKARNFVQQEFL